MIKNHEQMTSDSVTQVDSVTSTNVLGVAGRLEHQLDLIESVGFKSQPWKSAADSLESVATSPIDINWLVAQPALPYLVQALPTHLLYRSLMDHGIEDSLEVIEWVRGGALTRVLDYDLWMTAGQPSELMTGDEQPSGERFLQWIRWWNEISPEFAAQRVLELDEGLIVGCMTAACEIIPVGLNRMQEELSDDYWMTPDNRFGIKMKTSDPADFDVVHQFLHSLYKQDIRVAQSVLAHSAMLVREESIEEARRWRSGRLEDQGFLTADEARNLLKPRTQKQIAEMVQIALKTEPQRFAAVTQPNPEGDNLGQQIVDEDLHERLFDFIRTREDDELAQEVERTLGVNEIVRLVGTSAPHADVLLQDEDVLETFIDKVAQNTQQTLRSLEAYKARELKARVQNSSARLLFDETMAWLSESNFERMIDYKARIARTTNAVAAALGVANESSELGRVLTAVRGCLNIGLQRLLGNGHIFGLDNVVSTESTADAVPASQSAAVLIAIGPEAVFQIGWQTLQELATDALQMLVYVVDQNEQLKQKIGSDYIVRLSDGESVRLSVLQLHSRGRYLEVRKWFRQLDSFLDQGVAHILDSTLNRLPVFPIILMEDNPTNRGTTNVKPYERLEEVEMAKVFFNRLPQTVGFLSQGE